MQLGLLSDSCLHFVSIIMGLMMIINPCSGPAVSWLSLPGGCRTGIGDGYFDEWWEVTESQCRDKCAELNWCWGFEISRQGSKGYTRCRTHKDMPTHTLPIGKYICYVKDTPESRKAWGYADHGSSSGNAGGRGSSGAGMGSGSTSVTVAATAGGHWLSRLGTCAMRDGSPGFYDEFGGQTELDCRSTCAQSQKCVAYEFETPSRCEMHWQLPQITLPADRTACFVKDTPSARKIWGYNAGAGKWNPEHGHPESRPSYCSKLLGVLSGNLPLGYVDLSNENLVGCVLSKANLPKTKFAGADLSNAVLAEANLEEAVFDMAILVGTSLVGAMLDKADFNQAVCDRANFQFVRAANAKFIGASLKNCNFRQATLAHAVFERADIAGCTFEYANLEYSSFVGVTGLAEAKFEGAKLNGATGGPFLP